MKFKKIFITLPVVTMGAGLLATVLTSCNTNKIDDDKKITLNDEADLAKGIGNKANYKFTDAVKWALTRSTSWATFKEALAEEIILKWYEDRMYEDKDGKKERNKTFKSNYDEWKYQINKDYDSLVQSQKTKYGTNYKFYMQNEYLSQYGGTEETYKHAKLVEKVKTEFTTNVWKFNYFGVNTGEQKAGEAVRNMYPQIFTSNASTTISREELNNPNNWSKIGFFASVNPSFSMKTWPEKIGDIDVDFLAKNPDGDYATIQKYVFDRYFNTEKPFFSAASLFKYSKPHGIEEGDKLSVIYSTANTAVKLPDEPNESFPFFGGAEPTDATKGTRMFMEWYNAFNNGDFATQYKTGVEPTTVTHKSNGTVSISNTASGGKGKYSEDSQTLLLASANQMLGGTESLYVPYATVAAQMFQNMLLDTPVLNNKMNITKQAYIESLIPKNVFEAVKDNNPAIFKNFFFDPTQYDLFAKAGGALNSFLDLTKVYPDGLTGEGTEEKPYEYHCPLFKDVKNFTYFYGDTTKSSAKEDLIQINGKYWSPKSGIIFVTNTMYVDSFVPQAEGVTGINGQPWALQLNQSGMHAQTIDGYSFIINSGEYLEKAVNKAEAAKLVFSYRLMQKRADQIDFMSGDLLGSSGKLKTYFTNNLADIVLELAQKTGSEANLNVFRNLTTFKSATAPEQTSEEYFFNKFVAEQKFVLADLTKYLELVATYDADKKKIELIDKINSYIYEYRSKVITTAKSTTLMKTIYGNGLLAPLTYAYGSFGGNNHNYRECNIVVDINYKSDGTIGVDSQLTKNQLTTDLEAIEKCNFVNVSGVAVNSDSPFSPQVTAAKNAMSNRYWYKSAIVDKVMYAFTSNKTGLSNKIKSDVYETYESQIIAADAKLKDTWKNITENDVQFNNALTSTYKKNKVITGNTTYATIGAKTDKFADFIKKIDTTFDANLNYQKALNGPFADDALTYTLFNATLAYLCINEYENLYKVLNSKIGENEVAVVGYLNKLNPWTLTEEEKKTYTKAVSSDTELMNRYGFNPDVENLFDQDGFAGGDVASEHAHSKDASNTYWNLIAHDTNALAGFTGIQSKSTNSFDSASGLQTAVFDKFSWSTHGAKNIVTGKDYASNEGCWFGFAGSKETNNQLITFSDIIYKDEEGKGANDKLVRAIQFQGQDGVGTEDERKLTQQVLRLAKKIANYDSIDDLKTLAKSLADTFDGGSIFKLIGYGEKTYQDVNLMRAEMLEALPHFKLNDDGKTLGAYVPGEFEKCFNRVSNVEVHTTTKVESNQDYCFEDGKGNGYHAFIKQINKADITEKRLHYNYDKGAWKYGADATITAENAPISDVEFLYILCSTAADTATQSLVITQAIKNVLGDDKLTIYDANVYNTFDTSWVKDWVKKPMGK